MDRESGIVLVARTTDEIAYWRLRSQTNATLSHGRAARPITALKKNLRKRGAKRRASRTGLSLLFQPPRSPCCNSFNVTLFA